MTTRHVFLAVEWLLAIPLALFTVGWGVSRVVAYFVFTEEEMLADFAQTVIPANCSPIVLETFHKNAIAHLFADKERYALVRFHITLSAVLMFIMVRWRFLPFPAAFG